MTDKKANIKDGKNIELDGVTVINEGISLVEKEETKEEVTVPEINIPEVPIQSIAGQVAIESDESNLQTSSNGKLNGEFTGDTTSHVQDLTPFPSVNDSFKEQSKQQNDNQANIGNDDFEELLSKYVGQKVEGTANFNRKTLLPQSTSESDRIVDEIFRNNPFETAIKRIKEMYSKEVLIRQKGKEVLEDVKQEALHENNLENVNNMLDSKHYDDDYFINNDVTFASTNSEDNYDKYDKVA